MTEEFKEGCEMARDMILSRIACIQENCLKEGNRGTAHVIGVLYKDLVNRYGDVFEDFRMTTEKGESRNETEAHGDHQCKNCTAR